ncbi:MAG TPA: acyl-CoA dehydrogenase, partial [Maritimibacter sp.]|nr:acyl-CoA dehydrogenase [Maritimibacter sp.]
MPKDATLTQPILDDLLTLTEAAMTPVEAVLGKAKAAVRAMVVDGDRVSPALLEENQHAAHALAWLATYVEALRQMRNWAGNLQSEGSFGEM